MPLPVNSQQFFTDDLLTLQQTGSGAAPSWTANLQCDGWPRGTGGHNEEEGSLRLSRRAGASLQVRVNMRNNLVMGQATDLRASSTPISHQGLHYGVLLASNLQHTCRAIWRLSPLVKILFWLDFGVEMSW